MKEWIKDHTKELLIGVISVGLIVITFGLVKKLKS